MTCASAIRKVVLLVSAMTVAACTNDARREGDFALLAGFGAALVAPLRTASEPRQQAASTPQAVSRVLEQIPQDVPVVRVEAPNLGQSAFAVEAGRNRGTRTFSSFSGQNFTFRNGVLIGTRGLAYDLMSIRTDNAEQLIANRQSGSVSRTYRFLDPGDDEVDFPVDCEIASEGADSTTLSSGQSFAATRMRETCQTGPFTFNNFYWVTGSGRVVRSEQWVSREVGMVRIEHVRE